MKKSVLLLASMLMGTGAFAQGWVKPVPGSFTPMVDDGTTALYLYNVEAGGFFTGANDYETRASVSYSVGAPVKMTAQYEDDDKTVPLGTWALVDSVAKFKEYRKTFADNAQAIWVDNNNGANANEWIVTKIGDNKYEISNPMAAPGKLSMFNKFDGAANTRLYLIDPEDPAEEFYTAAGEQRWEGVCSTWAFVTPEVYNAFQPKMAQYASAMTLGEKITATKASYEGIDLKDAEAIYNNTNSTVAELDSATNKIIPASILSYQKSKASAENPADMTDLVPNNDFEEATTGWTTTTGAPNVGLATNRCDNNAYAGTTMTGKFWENWKSEPYSGKMYTTLANLPGGVYKLKMAAFINPGNSGNVYFNDYKINKGGKTSEGKIVPLGQGNDIPADFEVWAYINDGDSVEIGLQVENNESNWIGIDNVKLTYYGAGTDAYKLWYTTTRTEIINTMNGIVTPETKYDKSQKAIFEAALAKGDAATSKEEYLAAIANLQSAADATFASIDAYKNLEAQVAKFKDDETEYSDDGPMSLFMDLLNAGDISEGKDAIAALAKKVPAEKMVEVAPIQIFTESTFSTEYINEYIPALKELRDYCASKSMIEGTKIALEDADFTDPNGKGWTKVSGGITWRGGFHAFPVAESYHSAFDFYQEVTVPDGIYSLSLNGFCRPDDGETEPAAEIYMNEYATKFKSLEAGALPVEEAKDGFNCYLTKDADGAYHSNPIFKDNDTHSSPANNTDRDVNGYIPDGMEGASIAFSANRYQAKVYGMVEGGKIKLGARCTSTHQWVLWGNFVLTYEGDNAEAMEALAKSFVEPAQQYLDDNSDNMSSPAVTALENAISAVNDASGVDELKPAVKALNAELENAKANVAAVAAFNAAKEAMDEAASEYGETASEAAVNEYNTLSEVEYNDLTTESIKECITKFNECAAALRIPSSDDASDEDPADFTQVIVNNDFETGNYDGWTLVKREGASGNYQIQNGFDGGKSMEFWSNTNGVGTKFDFYQDIANLPAGTYELTVDAANSLNGQQAVNTGRAAVYAAKGDGKTFTYVSDTIAVQEEGCADLHDTYSVIIKLEEGQTLRIGAMNTGDLEARWVMVDNFTLTYYGKNSAQAESEGKDAEVEVDIDEAPAAAVAPVAIYSAAGAKINALQKGINIVVMSDGSVNKVLVK